MAETLESIVTEKIDGTVGLVNPLALTHYVMDQLGLHGPIAQRDVYDDVIKIVKKHDTYGIDICLAEDDIEYVAPEEVQLRRILHNATLEYLAAHYGEDEYDFAAIIESISQDFGRTLVDEEITIIFNHAKIIIKNDDHHPDAVKLQRELEQYQDA